MKNKKIEIVIAAILLFVAFGFVYGVFNKDAEFPFKFSSFLGGDFITFFLGLALLVGIFLALREVVAWYWKINRTIELLEKIERNTRNDGK